jgi:signal transduction histidine kinase
MIKGQADKKDLTVEFLPEEALPSLYADPGRFKQILYNLLSNAVKFTPDGGRITVYARRAVPDALEIAVADTGIGIKAEDQAKLFQEFVRLENSLTKGHEGTGLGLALTKKLVELHGGKIWVESRGEGSGSTFTFTLPMEGPMPQGKEAGEGVQG